MRANLAEGDRWVPPLFRRATIWMPTPLGWLALLAASGLAAAAWVMGAEPFFAVTERPPAEVLIVEGWIGINGVRAAKAEFDAGKYRWVVGTGPLSSNRWGSRQWSYAEEAAELLVRLGVPADRVLTARSAERDNHRSFAAAEATARVLAENGIAARHATVFTIGVHARRSRLLFARALGPSVRVGSIAWVPPNDPKGPWWNSSERAQDLIKESVAYPFELFFHSARWLQDE